MSDSDEGADDDDATKWITVQNDVIMITIKKGRIKDLIIMDSL